MAQEWEGRLNTRTKDASLLPFIDVLENFTILTGKIHRAREKGLRNVLKNTISYSFPIKQVLSLKEDSFQKKYQM